MNIPISDRLKSKKKPRHPGSIIDALLKSEGISQSELARAIFVSRQLINQIIKGTDSCSVDMAIRLGKFFTVEADLFLRVQADLDLWKAYQKNRSTYKTIKTYGSE